MRRLGDPWFNRIGLRGPVPWGNAPGGYGGSFSPLDIAGLQLWLDASQITGLNDGDSVTTWNDLSGNGTHMTQAVAINKPVYKTNQFNGLPIVRFDGATSYLKNATANWRSADFLGSMIAVYKLTSVAAPNFQAVITSMDQATASLYGMEFRGLESAANKFMSTAQKNNDTVDKIFGSTVLTAATINIAAWLSTGVAYNFYRNGTSQILVVNSGADNGDWFADTTARDNIVVGARESSIGVATYFYGDIACILYYSVTLAAADLSTLGQYLAAKWGGIWTP